MVSGEAVTAALPATCGGATRVATTAGGPPPTNGDAVATPTATGTIPPPTACGMAESSLCVVPTFTLPAWMGAGRSTPGPRSFLPGGFEEELAVMTLPTGRGVAPVALSTCLFDFCARASALPLIPDPLLEAAGPGATEMPDALSLVGSGAPMGRSMNGAPPIPLSTPAFPATSAGSSTPLALAIRCAKLASLSI